MLKASSGRDVLRSLCWGELAVVPEQPVSSPLEAPRPNKPWFVDM